MFWVLLSIFKTIGNILSENNYLSILLTSPSKFELLGAPYDALRTRGLIIKKTTRKIFILQKNCSLFNFSFIQLASSIDP
jgi:hypothetical protein